MKEKLAAKMAGGSGGGGGAAKVVEAPEGDYSDPSGLSGTYYATTDMAYGDGKKVAKIIKLEFLESENAVVMHAMKGESDPSKFYMADYRKYARDNFKMSHFSAGDYHVITIEPGVVAFGAYEWAPDDYPGKTPGMMIADTAKIKPVILVKDESQISKYTYADAKRIIGDCGTKSEIYNTLRLAENTPTPSIGDLTSDKDLIAKSVALMKSKWADSPEPVNFQGCYIHNNDWGTVQYGKVLSTTKTIFSDEVTAIMLFKEPSNGLCYYYAVGISREIEDVTANGITTERGMQMTGTSAIQYITKAKLEETLTAIGK